MKFKFSSWSITPYLMVIALMGLQACGGGGGSTPAPADANPVGYYAGTFSYSSPATQGAAPADIAIKAIVDSSEFFIVHIDNVTPDTILYKGTFTDITATTFTANVKIYRNGTALSALASDATITNGAITEKSSMSGTLSGTGATPVDYSSSSFSLTYDTVVNARAVPTISGPEGWNDPSISGQAGFVLEGNGTDISPDFGTHTSIVAELLGCGLDTATMSNINSEVVGRIRKYSVTHTNCTSTNNILVDGYLTPFDSVGGTDDDRYLWITLNETRFFAGELQ